MEVKVTKTISESVPGDSNILGLNIKELLYIKRESQLWLAEKCDVTPAHISRIVKGKVFPSFMVLKAIADALEVTVDEIISKDFTKTWKEIITLWQEKELQSRSLEAGKRWMDA